MQRLLGKALPLGSIMIDIEGLALTATDVKRLLNPLVAGVILFSRHYESIEQLQKLTTAIHQLRHPRLLIAVDHEGGRVQRFRAGFTGLPAMQKIGDLYQQNKVQAQQLAETTGWLLATELLVCGVDFSFAPVVDLNYGTSSVIGDRSFAEQEKDVADLSFQLMNGMHKAGMCAVAKHFPGHGYIKEDTHTEIAIDYRSLEQIIQKDIQPFLHLISNNIEAIMPAHVIYPKIDELPAGFSAKWLQDILRKQCHFDGAIISDDISMRAVTNLGTPSQVAAKALAAGCDLVLVCNDLRASDEVLANLQYQASVVSHARLIRLHGKPIIQYQHLGNNPLWQAATTRINKFVNQIQQQDILL
jgi:beta-N-acetylhexosaminidase